MTGLLAGAFVVNTVLMMFFAFQVERERNRHRRREQAITDRIIEVTATKRWEDYVQIRKELHTVPVVEATREVVDSMTEEERHAF